MRYFIASLLFLAACGSQVVEFPLDASGPNGGPGPSDDGGVVDPTDSGSDDDGGSQACSCPSDDGGGGGTTGGSTDSGTTGDGGSTTGGTGDAGKDGGSTGGDGGGTTGGHTDGGTRTCGKSRKTCDDYRNYGQCVSSCAHACHGTHGKSHRGTCGVYLSCFKECKATCDCLKDKCKDDPRCED